METIEFDRVPQGPNARVLDVGCGEGRHAVAATDVASEVVGVDLDVERLRTAQEAYETDAGDTDAWATFLRGDALSLPFATDAFDVVVCSEVLEHLADYEAAIVELRRVCRPGGALAVSVPRYGPERICWLFSEGYHQVDGGHVRIFDRDALRETIEDRGFRQIGGHFAHALHTPYWWLKCLLWDRLEGGEGRDDDEDGAGRQRPAPDGGESDRETHDCPGRDGSEQDGTETVGRNCDPTETDQPLVLRAYERFLEWDIVEEPRSVRALERALNPLFGKSVVLYFEAEP